MSFTELDLGTVQASVEKVVITGVARTNENLLKKQLVNLFKSKDFREICENIIKTKDRFHKLDIFKSVRASVHLADDITKTDSYKIIFHVKEKNIPSGKVTLNVDSDGTKKGVGAIRVINLTGNAETADLNVEIGSDQTVSRYATLTKPIANNPYIRMSVGGSDNNADHYWARFLRCEKSVFSEAQVETATGVHKFQWDAVWREIKVKDNNVPLSVLKESGHFLKTSLRHIFQTDTRPEFVFPDSGHLCKLTQELATVYPGCLTHHSTSEEDANNDDRALHLKVENSLHKSLRLTNWLVAELTLSAALTHSLTKKHPVHIADRFFLGGPLELRGFGCHSVGPVEPLLRQNFRVKQSVGDAPIVDDSAKAATGTEFSPIGADAYTLAGLHLYTPLPYWGAEPDSFASNFRLHGFYLYGVTMKHPVHNLLEVYTTSQTMGQFGQCLMDGLKSNQRAVTGVGLVVRFGGILRFELNYCIPLLSQSTDRTNPGLSVGFGMYYV